MKNITQLAAISQTGVAFNTAAISRKIANLQGKGVLVTIVISNQVGDTATTVKLQHADPGQTQTGAGVDIPGAVTAALAANGTYALLVYPGVSVVANSAISQAIGCAFNVVATQSGTTSQHDVLINCQLID